LINYSDIKEVCHQLDSIDLQNFVFISAAAFSSDLLFLNEDDSSISNLYEANIKNNIYLIQKLLQISLKLEKSKFIYVSSFRADTPSVGTCLYSSSKVFMEKLFESLSIEYSKFNIKFLILKIGLFEKGLSKNLPFDIEDKKLLKKNIASGRVSKAEDIISAIEFMIDNDYINGSTVDMTGKFKFDIKF